MPDSTMIIIIKITKKGMPPIISNNAFALILLQRPLMTGAIINGFTSFPEYDEDAAGVSSGKIVLFS